MVEQRLTHTHGQIVIMTTNHPLVLDSALKRPGRVDYSFEFTYANKNQIKKMFETFLKNQKDTFPKFYKQVKHPKQVDIGIRVSRVGNKSFDYEYGLFLKGDTECSVSCITTLVCFDYVEQKTVPVFDVIREQME